MSQSRVRGVRVVGAASAVPDRVVTAGQEAEVFGAAGIENIARRTGVRARRVAPEGLCTSDLCLAAAERLMDEAGWDRGSVDVMVLVTQTPDYVLPATSCSLHGRLGLGKHCAAFDVNLGCSGYTHGLWLGSHLVASGAARRLLLLVGETMSRAVHPRDRSARPLFGDAGTATLLEHDAGAPATSFVLGTDGAGQNNLIVPAGSFRLPRSARTAEAGVGEDGNVRGLDNLYMNGTEVFLFTLEEVPPLVEAVLSASGWAAGEVDAFVFHQANEFILKHLAAKMQLPMDRVPLCLDQFGNTNSASVPLTMTTRLATRLRGGPARLVLAGFGVGFSWSAVAVETDRLVMPDLIEVDASAALDRLAGRSAAGPETSHLPEPVRALFDETTR